MNQKQQNLKKTNKKSDKSLDTSKKPSNIPKFNMFAIGYLDLTFIIEFKDKEISQLKEGKTIEDINMENIKLLEFIKNNQDIINRIKLNSDNDSLKRFLLINKTSKGNRQIEFFPFCSPKFKENTFFQEIFDKVTKNNGIIINKNSLDKKQGYTIKINLIYKKYSNNFEYELNEKETDMEIKSESPVNPKTPIKKEIEYEDDDDENNKWVKKGLIPNFKRKGCMLSKLRPTFEKYDLVYVNFNELRNIKGDFEDEDFFELLKFFKEKKSKIFVNYYKPIKSELVTPPDDDEDDDNNYEDDNIEQIEKNNDNDNIEKNNKISESENNNNEENSNDEKSKDSEKFSSQNSLNKLYHFSDIYFFDENQAYQLFDKHLKYINEKQSVSKLNKSKIYDYFISSIAGNGKSSEEKIGLFLNELEQFTIVICSQKKGTKETMDSKLYPQKTTRNIEIIKQYKELIQQNKDEYYNIFSTLMLGALSSNNIDIGEELNSAFRNALTIIKKDVECNKNKGYFDVSKLIDYKTIQNGSRENKNIYTQKRKEKGFVLDCLNKEKSKLKEYMPLKDKNLKWYFRSKTNKKYLVQRGFVDQKGYIMYDKQYRETLGSRGGLNNNNIKKNKSLSKIIKDISMKNKLNSTSNCFSSQNTRTKDKLP